MCENLEKIQPPRGLIAETAKRCEIHQNIVGETLGRYKKVTLGTTAKKRKLIVTVAAEVAREKVIEMEAYLEYLEELNA